MKTKSIILASVLATLVCLSSLAAAGELSPVVSTVWLQQHLDDSDLVTLHIGPPGSYEEAHIPGARKASLRALLRIGIGGIRDEMPAAEDLAEALGLLGIGDRSRVVVYFADENAAWAAGRYLLTLEYAGMAGRAAYLDGGLPKWTAEEAPVSTEAPSVTAADLTIEPVGDVIVDTEWLRTRFDRPGIALVDGRPLEDYAGRAGHWTRLGHIPGAGNIPFFAFLAEDPGYMLKDREEIGRMFREAGAKPGDTVVVYCGTGLWGSLPYLAARHAGYDVRLYDASFQEWSSIEDLPVATVESRDG